MTSMVEFPSGSYDVGAQPGSPWLDHLFLADYHQTTGAVMNPSEGAYGSGQPSDGSGSDQMHLDLFTFGSEDQSAPLGAAKAPKAAAKTASTERRRQGTSSLAGQLVEAQDRLQQQTATYAAALAENQRLCDRANILEHAVQAREAKSLFLARLSPGARPSTSLAPEVQHELRTSALPRPLARRLAPAISATQCTSAELTFVPTISLLSDVPCPSIAVMDIINPAGGSLVPRGFTLTKDEIRKRCMALSSTSISGRGPDFDVQDIMAFKAATPEHFRAHWTSGVKELSVELVRHASHCRAEAKRGGPADGGAGGRSERLAALSHEMLGAANTVYIINAAAIVPCCGQNMDTGVMEEAPADHWRDVVRACQLDKEQLRQIAAAVAIMHEQLALLEAGQSQLVDAATGAVPSSAVAAARLPAEAVDALGASVRRVQAVYETAHGFMFSPRLLSAVQLAQMLASSWPYLVDPSALMYAAAEVAEEQQASA